MTRGGAVPNDPPDVGVFSCGPKRLGAILNEKCKEYGFSHAAEVF